jgi:diadenosine tetraphosphate (Ap4A) HIT family hydrolase
MDNQKNPACVLCDVVSGGVDITGKKPLVLYQNDSFVATADTGSMVEGYILIYSKRHIQSMGDLNMKEFADYLDVQNHVGTNLKMIYGKNCVSFEHGTARQSKGNDKLSVVHAHFHMIAMDKFTDKMHARIIQELEMKPLKSQRDLRHHTEQDYMHYVAGDGSQFLAVDDGSIESQYMRKRIAEQHGVEWNWKIPEIRKSFETNVRATEQKWIENAR